MGLSETSSRLTPSRKPRPLGPLEKSSSFLQRSLRELHENRSDSLVAPGSASGFRRSLVGADNTLIEAVAEASREGAAADADAAVFAESRRLHPGTLTSVEAWLEARGVGAFEPPPAQRLAAALSRWTTWRLEAAADIRAPKGAASSDAPAAAGRVEGSRQVA